MKVIVTGSSGFMGQHIVRELLRKGYQVVGVDTKRPHSWNCRYSFELSDINNIGLFRKIIALHSPDAVIHLAARIDLDGKTLQDYATNIDGVKNIVEAINRTPSVKRCIFTSSQLVCSVDYIPKNDTDYNPNTLYGESKVLTEKIVRKESGDGWEWCITRPTTIWGPGMSLHYQRLFKAISSGLYFHIGRKPLLKSYGYVGNSAYQYVKLLEAPSHKIAGKTFYIADYEPIVLQRWIDTIAAGIQAKPVKTLPGSIANIIALSGDILNRVGFTQFPFNSFRLKNILACYQFDLSATKAVCGNLPYTIEEGIKQTTAWLYNRRII